MRVSQQQSASNDGANAQDPVQTDSECQWPRGFDPLFDDLPSGGLEGAGPSGHTNGGFDMSSFNPGWPLAPSMAGQSAYQSPQINFGASQPPSMNQGFNSLHTATQQHQWNLGFSNAASHGQQNQFSGSSGNNQSGVPLSPQSATHEPQAMSSQPLSGTIVNGTRMSSTNNQAPQARLPTPALAPDELNLGHDEGNVPMPDWIALVKPTPLTEENVITLRRETHVALDIILEKLPRQPPGGCSGIKVPTTASVVNKLANTIGKPHLDFRIRVNGATSKRCFETVCATCEKRERKRKRTPSFIDFCAPQDIIEPIGGKVRVKFIICCYSKCHQESGYFLDVTLFEDVDQNNIVVQSRLPFTFNVVAKVEPPQGQKRTRRQIEESPAGDQRNVRARRDGTPQRGTDDERNDHPMVAANPRNAPQGGQYREGDASSAPPPAVSPPQPPRNAAPNPGQHSPWNPPPAIVPPSTDERPTPTLTEVNPESGSITGGAKIWLTGMEIPTGFKLFARFGTAVGVVPTNVITANLLVCNLPPAATPGLVNVTLSKYPQQNAPEYGTSTARFQYIGDHDQLIPILLRIQGQGYPESSPVLQALLTSLRGHQPNHGLQGGSHGAGPRDDPIEISLIEALSCLQTRPNFHEIVSTENDYHQTLAHLSILYDYPSLLGRLAEWHIDLTIADVNGLTALHCAYMKGDLDSVRILRRGGASETATDNLGRTPSELLSEGFEGFDWDIDLDTDVAAGLDAEVYPETDDIDEQWTLGEQLSALDLDDDNDSGHGQSDSEDDASGEEEDPDGMVIYSHSGDDGGDSGDVSGDSGDDQIAPGFKEPTIHIMNQLLLEKTKKNHGARMTPDTRYDPAKSSVFKKFREAEAEPAALDSLNRISPDGATSFTPLRTKMRQAKFDEVQALKTKVKQEEVDEFKVLKTEMKQGGVDKLGIPAAFNVQYYQVPPQPPPVPVYGMHSYAVQPPSYNNICDQATAVLPQQPSLPQAPARVKINPDNDTITLPAWLSLVRPEPLGEDQVIMVRRERQVVLNINFKKLSSVTTRKNLVIPSTAGVRTEDYYVEKDVVHLSVRVFGVHTQCEYKGVCGACRKREGKRKGNPSLVDFCAASNVINAPKDEVAQVKFKFSCYPKHQSPNESAYSLEVELVERQHQGHLAPSQRVIATCRLPWLFEVGKLQRGQGAPAGPAGSAVPEASWPSGLHHMEVDAPSPRARVKAEPGVPTVESLIPSSPGPSPPSEGEYQGVPFAPSSNAQAPLAHDPRVKEIKQRKGDRVEAGLVDRDSEQTPVERRVRPRHEQWNSVPSTGLAGLSASAAYKSPSHPFTTAAGPGVTQGTIPHGVSSSDSPATSATPTPTTPTAPQLDSSVHGRQSSAQPAESSTPVLRSTNPRKGPVSGGIEIWLSMDNLPTTFTLYARFGSEVVPTTVENMNTLSCVLPSATHPGCVKVTLSRSAHHGAPEYGTSLASFEYHANHEPLIATLLRMEVKGRPEYTPSIRATLLMLQEDQAPKESDNSQAGQVEPALLNA